ncbi:MAG: sigma-70 family RNA polymerase sigma factor [Deltaproteobacteria bacterium]|nr:sigma-70 family RNA polymerase sigma factor [Deltaproteobacteria bacterium]
MTEKVHPPDEDEARWAAYMRASQEGDGEAFEALLKEILPRVRSQVFGRLGGREHAEDVVQNVLLSIHRSRHTYHPTRPFKPWLNAVTRNAVIDAVRARRNEWRHQSFDEHEVPGEDPPLPGASEAISPELESALSRLPEAQREAVQLLHLDQLSVREAASKTGTSIGAFKVRAHRGRVRLREILTGRKS